MESIIKEQGQGDTATFETKDQGDVLNTMASGDEGQTALVPVPVEEEGQGGDDAKSMEEALEKLEVSAGEDLAFLESMAKLDIVEVEETVQEKLKRHRRDAFKEFVDLKLTKDEYAEHFTLVNGTYRTSCPCLIECSKMTDWLEDSTPSENVMTEFKTQAELPKTSGSGVAGPKSKDKGKTSKAENGEDKMKRIFLKANTMSELRAKADMAGTSGTSGDQFCAKLTVPEYEAQRLFSKHEELTKLFVYQLSMPKLSDAKREKFIKTFYEEHPFIAREVLGEEVMNQYLRNWESEERHKVRTRFARVMKSVRDLFK